MIRVVCAIQTKQTRASTCIHPPALTARASHTASYFTITLRTSLTRLAAEEANNDMAVGCCLPEAAGLTLPLKKSEDVTLADGSLDVADDRTAGLVHELNLHLGHVTRVAGAAEDLEDLGELDVLRGSLLQSKNETTRNTTTETTRNTTIDKGRGNVRPPSQHSKQRSATHPWEQRAHSQPFQHHTGIISEPRKCNQLPSIQSRTHHFC